MSESPPLSPRALRTRAALVSAGFELLVERPIDAIPIDDFVARAGVGKGSFFNHFNDKQAFAEAVAAEVRLEVEALVADANKDIADPVERIAGGMRVAALFALSRPSRTIVLLRSHGSSTARADPLNRGLVEDMEAACAEGLVRPEAREAGVLYWLGLCQSVMTNIVERGFGEEEAARRLEAMLVLGLTGLGIPEGRARICAAHNARKLHR